MGKNVPSAKFVSSEQWRDFLYVAQRLKKEGATRLFLFGSIKGDGRKKPTPNSDADLGAEMPDLTAPVCYRSVGSIHVTALPTRNTENVFFENIRKSGRTFYQK